MKCPKCGSEVKEKTISYGKGHLDFETTSTVLRCINNECNHNLTHKELKHQQRLDRVLSVFHMCDAGYLKYDCIKYTKNEFVLNNYVRISLNTVESLLNDLNAFKE